MADFFQPTFQYFGYHVILALAYCRCCFDNISKVSFFNLTMQADILPGDGGHVELFYVHTSVYVQVCRTHTVLTILRNGNEL